MTGDAARAEVTLDGTGAGQVFDGVGALSAGGSSRLLYDYPEPERGQLLDYLFAPNHGAALQILKLEIGADTDSTSGAEPSHSRTPDDLSCDRGYEWWLATEAKRRNPHITLAALEWGGPGWFDGGFWSADNIRYIQSWLDCAARHGLVIDYIGGWNERGYDADWYKALRRALADSHPHVRIVAADEYESWSVATAMRRDPAFADAVDVVGSHDPCQARSLYRSCPSTGDARALGKPLWNSETSSQAHDVGAGPLARSLNREYIDGGMTAHIYWSLISAWYADLPIADTGLVLADTPWSGYYDIGTSIWALAHTTQFTAPGWRYLDAACGYLPGGASCVALRSDGGDYTVVVETLDATEPQAVTFRPAQGLSAAAVHMFCSDLRSADPDDYLVHTGQLRASGDGYTTTLHPGRVYTLTTTTGQGKGTALPGGTPERQLDLPYREDFESYGHGALARHFSDVNGGFQTAPAEGGRTGTCYEQVVQTRPIAWNSGGGMPPTTLVGDPRWWGDYEVTADALLPQAGAVEVLGRVDAQRGDRVSGYHLRIDDDGAWVLYDQEPHGGDDTLASGTAAFGTGEWHRVGLRFLGDELTVLVDGTPLATVSDRRHNAGHVGLRTGGFHRAQFDNLAVTPTGPAPRAVPHAGMTATATSARTANYRGYTYGPARAIDDRPNTFWHSDFPGSAGMPQSLTLDLGHSREIRGLSYRPRLDGDTKGMITAYTVYTSEDGRHFDPVAAGEWPVSNATKIARFDAPHRERHVRLEATAGIGGHACAAEVTVLE